MISIFHRADAKLMLSKSEKDFATLARKDVLWIDLLDPTGDEKRSAEKFLDTEIQSRAKAEEIESSSRYFETDRVIFANTNFLIPGPEEYVMEAVSFTLVDNVLVTVREVPLRSITELQRKVYAMPKLFPTGYSVFVNILDQRVDLDADMIEIMSKEISQYSKRINQKEDINEEFLLDINQLQDNAMIVRENIVDKQRLISSLIKSDKVPAELGGRFNILLQDVVSLINHADFSFERLEYLQNTVLGIINLDQNQIMKIFTLVSVLFMPATLVTGFYGMNVGLPFAEARLAWFGIIIFMLIVIAVILLVFRRKKML